MRRCARVNTHAGLPCCATNVASKRLVQANLGCGTVMASEMANHGRGRRQAGHVAGLFHVTPVPMGLLPGAKVRTRW